jgi:hypothetical protein
MFHTSINPHTHLILGRGSIFFPFATIDGSLFFLSKCHKNHLTLTIGNHNQSQLNTMIHNKTFGITLLVIIILQSKP